VARSKKKSPPVDTPQQEQGADPFYSEVHQPDHPARERTVHDEVSSNVCSAAIANEIEQQVALDQITANTKPIPDVTGAGVDINAVLAKHLESAASNPGSTKVLVARSSVIRPVKLVHAIASDMYSKNPETQRKDVIAACEAAGIATHTARTQYQIWHQAMKSDKAAQAARDAAPPKNPTAAALGKALEKNTAQRKKQK